jgi:hypothetical protein
MSLPGYVDKISTNWFTLGTIPTMRGISWWVSHDVHFIKKMEFFLLIILLKNSPKGK